MSEHTAEIDATYRPRVAFTHGSIAKVVTARRRYVCGNHLSCVEKHFIEPGQRYVRNSLPPHNREIGNEHWWFLRVCLDCCPEEHDERRLSSACKCGDCYHPVIGPDTDGEPCDWCRDCGCPSADHTRMTTVIPSGSGRTS